MHGQLGYDSMDNKGDAAGEMASLGSVNLGASAIAITAGFYHTCATLVGGGVKCWGRGDHPWPVAMGRAGPGGGAAGPQLRRARERWTLVTSLFASQTVTAYTRVRAR